MSTNLDGMRQEASVTGTVSDTLAFSGYDGYGYNGIDDVSLNPAAIPEPGSFTLMLLGLAGLIGVRRAMKRFRER